MGVTKAAPTVNDPCPACGASFRPAEVPTPEQFAAFRDKENPTTLPAHFDTATAEQREELGELLLCNGCGYRTRVKSDDGQ